VEDTDILTRWSPAFRKVNITNDTAAIPDVVNNVPPFASSSRAMVSAQASVVGLPNLA